MADSKQLIQLIFEGVDKTGAATQSALKNTEKFATSVQGATQPVADFTAGALKLEGAMLAAGVAVTAFSVKLASDFQSAVVDLAKVLSDTDDIEQYKNLALELGEAYGVASVNVLESITNYKQAGFSAEEAGILTKSGLDLVIAGNVEAAESSALLVASIKGFGAEAADSITIVDLLNSVSNEYAASTAQLLEGFATLSPVAKTAGLSLQETIGILTPGIEVFQSGAEVANALRTSLIAMVDDNPTVVAALDSLGVSQKTANGELKSAGDIYFEVAGALKGLEQEQQIYIASSLVGKNRTSQFLAVVNGLDTTLRIAGDSFDYMGSAAAEVALQLGTAEVAGNRAKVALTNLFIGLGAPLLEEFTGTADALTAIFQAMAASAKGEGGLGSLVSFVEEQFGALQLTMERVAENMPAALNEADFSGFSNGIEAVTGAVGALFGDIDLGTAEGLALAVTAIGDAFNALSQFSAGVIESFEPLTKAFFKVGEGIGEIDEEAFRSAGQLAGFTTQLNLLSGPAITVAAALISLREALAIGVAVKGATTAIGAVGGAGLLGSLGALSAFALAGAGGAGIGLFLGDQLDDLTNSLTDTEESLGTWVFSLIHGAEESEKLAKLLEPVPVKIKDVGEASETAADNVQNLANGVSDLDSEVGIINELPEIFNSMVPAIEGAAVAVDTLGESVADIELEERLALIEAQSVVTTASIEADAKTIVAAYESINTTIGSTGDSITSLFGLLGDDSISKLDKLDISAQIEAEAEERAKAFVVQQKLLKAQAKYLNAQADALNKGGAVVTVNGDGLKPHLEAIMFDILESIQVSTNEQGLDLLLGINT